MQNYKEQFAEFVNSFAILRSVFTGGIYYREFEISRTTTPDAFKGLMKGLLPTILIKLSNTVPNDIHAYSTFVELHAFEPKGTNIAARTILEWIPEIDKKPMTKADGTWGNNYDIRLLSAQLDDLDTPLDAQTHYFIFEITWSK